jgi:hypothetical protein
MHVNIEFAFKLVLFVALIRFDSIKAEENLFEIVSPEIYKVYWIATDTEITGRIEVKTVGWVSFGIAYNGNFDGADLFVAWVTPERSYFIDCHVVGKSIFPDTLQNWKMTNAVEINGYTNISFSRKIRLTDEDPDHDLNILKGSPYITYAWGIVDPISLINFETANKGVYNLPLLSYFGDALTSAVQIQTMNVIRKSLPNNKKEFSYCQPFKFGGLNILNHLVQVIFYIRY